MPVCIITVRPRVKRLEARVKAGSMNEPWYRVVQTDVLELLGRVQRVKDVHLVPPSTHVWIRRIIIVDSGIEERMLT